MWHATQFLPQLRLNSAAFSDRFALSRNSAYALNKAVLAARNVQ